MNVELLLRLKIAFYVIVFCGTFKKSNQTWWYYWHLIIIVNNRKCRRYDVRCCYLHHWHYYLYQILKHLLYQNKLKIPRVSQNCLSYFVFCLRLGWCATKILSNNETHQKSDMFDGFFSIIETYPVYTTTSLWNNWGLWRINITYFWYFLKPFQLPVS